MIAREETFRVLMTRAQSGDKQAYAVLLEQVGKWLRRFFAQKIAPDAVDDLVQDTLISLHRKRASYDPARPFAADELQDQHSEASHEDVVGAKISIDGLLRRLPDGQAMAIRLVKIDGLSISEACAKCGQSEPLVKVNIHRGLKKLAALIESE
jgi:RNA polymerase sigma-70 factor (ECF subfamily)